MIEIKGICKKYNNTLFDQADAVINSGQKTYIRGINGSGKSVLLKMMVGYYKPDSGEIVADGYTVGKDGDFLRDAGISINAPQFVPGLTGMENLLELAAIRKTARKEDILMLAERLSLDQDLNKKYRLYSMGMQQKLRVIQALMEHPRYLILDEIFDALDDQSKQTVQELLDEYLKDHAERYVIYTSHEDRMDRFADRTLMIKDAKIVEISE